MAKGKVDKTELDRVTEIAKFHELQKTIRWGIVAIGAVAALWAIAYGIKQLAQSLSWAKLLLACFATVFGPAGVFWIMIRKIKAYTRRTHWRMRQLEKDADPNRTTSGLREDGTSPPEDKL